MMLLYFNSEKGMNYYYSNETQQIYAMKNKGSGGLQVGLVAGASMIIYFVLNKIDVQIKTNVNILYWTTLILGIIAGQILFYLGKKRYERLKNEDPRKAYQKIGNHLAYKGFNYDIIKKVLNKLFNDVDEYSC